MPARCLACAVSLAWAATRTSAVPAYPALTPATQQGCYCKGPGRNLRTLSLVS